MTDIKLMTDANGHSTIVLSDEERFGRRPRGLAVNNILIRASDGAVFTARPDLPGLSRLGAPEAEMVEYYLDNEGGPRAPNVFAGDSAPDG